MTIEEMLEDLRRRRMGFGIWSGEWDSDGYLGHTDKETLVIDIYPPPDPPCDEGDEDAYCFESAYYEEPVSTAIILREDSVLEAFTNAYEHAIEIAT